MVKEGKIQDSSQLFLLMDSQLEEMIECTQGIGVEITDGKLFSNSDKKEIIDLLDKEGIVFRRTLGQEWVFTRVNSKERTGILISFVPVVEVNQKHQVRADIAEELNNVLRREIKDHKSTQANLKSSQAHLQAIFDSSAIYIWSLKSDMTISSFNGRFANKMWSWFEIEVESGAPFYQEAYEENTESSKRFERQLKGAFKGNQAHLEVQLTTMDKEDVWMELFMVPIMNANSEVEEVSCIAFESTDKKRIEHQVSQSLKEKETLLQEIHHRVKNNLQIISSILNLQSSYVKDENSLGILKESQNRIRSMSFIHERLYLNKTFGSVEMRDYISGLVSQLIYSYSINREQVQLDMKMDEVILSLDQAIPCGLIINEIVSNSLKYAFPNGRKGKIEVSVKEKGERLAVYIGDDGIGIDGEVDIEASETLGMQLIFSLTEQLDGDIEFSSEKGTKYLITFDKIKQKELWPETQYS